MRRAIPVGLALAALLVAATLSSSAAAGTGELSLTSSGVQLTQTSATEWTVAKVGSVNATSSTVTWTITATEDATVEGLLVLAGQLTVTNSGSGGATIGNVVVNLQTKSGSKWVTQSSNVADATNGDAATTANIFKQASSEKKSSFTEDAASGELQFMDAGTNTLFSLVPQVTIPAGSTVTLLFSASFDNNVLDLATGTATRAEIIVSFGNATTSNASAPNIDINGNGVIDPDEARVRSVPSRLTLAVPAQTPGDSTVTLSDTLADITTTGTVTFSNAVFNLGATSGTVAVSYDPGTAGGTITNCAQLTGTGIDLEACDTQTIAAPATCTPGRPGCGWTIGNVVTYNQTVWGDSGSTPNQLLSTQFFTTYPSGIVEIGIPGTAGFSARFTDPAVITTYLPASGTLAPLNADLIDPTSTSSGAFGGEVLALTLNVDFSTLLGGSVPFGNLSLCGMSPSSLNGTTVSGFLGLVNTLLGGGSNGYTIAELAPILSDLNSAFDGGAASTFAQDHLVNGACGWQTGDVVTVDQIDWGESTTTAGALLNANFGTIYAGSDLVVGGNATMTFTSAGAVFSYLPAIGTVGVLTGDLQNPQSSSSGEFGGEVVALQINVDFSDADLLANTTALGDLRICNFTAVPALNGQTVRQFLATANSILGGASGPITAATASAVASLINTAFLGGAPSVFAQATLVVAAACP